MNGMAMGKVAVLPLSEDSPPDLLAGGMDLRVVLPCGSVTRCNVDRSTPIMDLLVQLARAHRISPAAHTLQPFGMNNTPLHSQPSTPIGALDVFTVKIVPKARPLAPLSKRTAPRPTPAQPFEQTFRLQVHLPRNQLFVTRASRATLLGDIRQLACGEKNLDPNKYELRHPANLDQRLDPDLTLGECAPCGLTEVALVAAGGRGGQPNGLPDIMSLRRQDDKRGQFGYSMADGSVSSASSGSLGGRSTSPAPSDGERSTSPPAMQPLQQLQPPSRPGRKRRPAPKPPVAGNALPTATEMNNNINKEVISSGGTVISHSRNSSDSSGYHEASVLSESPDGHHTDSLRSGSSGKLQSCVSQPNLSLSRSMTNLNMSAPQQQQQQQLSVRGNRNSIAVLHDSGHGNDLDRVPGAYRASTNSLATAGQRKKKAPPPPPPAQSRPTSTSNGDQFLKTQSLERPSPVDATPQTRLTKSSTLPSTLAATTPTAAASACPPPAFATGSSSSCPTPTPSEQSVHLSGKPSTADPVVVGTLSGGSRRSSSSSSSSGGSIGSPNISSARGRFMRSMVAELNSGTVALRPCSLRVGKPYAYRGKNDAKVRGRFKAGDEAGKVGDESSAKDKDSFRVKTEKEDSFRGKEGDQDSIKDRNEDSVKDINHDSVKDTNQDSVKDRNHDVDAGEADSDLGTADLSPPRSEIHDDESSLEHSSDGKSTEIIVLQECVANSHQSINEIALDECKTKKTEDEPDAIQSSAASQVPVEEEWEYRLPSPPSAFRDDRSRSPTVTEYESLNLTEANVSSSTGWVDKPAASVATEDLVVKRKPSQKQEEEKVIEPPTENLERLPSNPDSDLKKSSEVEGKPQEELPSSRPAKAPSNETVINSTNVPNETEKRKLEAAVLDELNKVLNEQRSSTLPASRPISDHAVPVQEPAPIENFSMAVYSRPTSAEGMAAIEVRPSLVLARRSSFSNSNGNLNAAPRPVGTGVRRTTSHATLVGGRRDNGGNKDGQSMEILESSDDRRRHNKSSTRHEVQPLGRAVSEMNLCAGLPMAPLEPELLKEFMEWRQQKQRDQQEKEKQHKMAASPELQSPQVLRTILSQSQDDIRGKPETVKEISEEVKQSTIISKVENVESSKPSLPETKVEEPVRRNVPRGPPSIQLSTWNERPKRQVSIKMDRDYWIGVGKAALRPTQPIKENTEQKKAKDAVLEDKSHHEITVSSSTEIPNKVNLSQNHNGHSHVTSAEVSSKSKPPSETVQRLSRQYIVHTTPSGFRRPVDPVPAENTSFSTTTSKVQPGKISTSEEADLKRVPKLITAISTGALPDKFEKPSQSLSHQVSLPETTSVEIPVTPKNDPSRVPIVRAVELKKPSIVTDARKPLQRQNATTNSNNSVVYFSSGPIATSSVSASAKPVNVNYTSSSNAAPPVKKFTSVVDISGPSSDNKPVNSSSEDQPIVHVNGFASHSEPKKNLPMPVVKGFKLAQGVVNRQLSAPAATPPPPASSPSLTPAGPVPPPAPVMPVLRKVPRPASLPAPARVQDPRDQLLDAIRNFGGRTKLRPTT